MGSRPRRIQQLKWCPAGDDNRLLSIPDSRATGQATPVSGKGAAVKDSQERVHEPSNYILFPMAVGALFLVFLVAGALLG